MSVVFDQLRISDDGQSMFIDAHVNQAESFDNAYLKKVVICTEEQVSETNPTNYGENFIYEKGFLPLTDKEVHLVLSVTDFNENFAKVDLSSNMFFVYVEVEWNGVVPLDTPCTLDETITLGVTLDYGVIFNQAMGYTRELAEDCQVPKEFIDFMLKYEALKLAIETDHFWPAVGFWKSLVGNNRTDTVIKPCRCHG